VKIGQLKQEMQEETTAEMKYMRRTAAYTWTDHKTNTEIAKELNITPVLDKIQDYNRNWIQHVNLMPQITQTDKKTTPPKGRRNQGRPSEETSGRVRPERVKSDPIS
jgi:hypothetical protein